MIRSRRLVGSEADSKIIGMSEMKTKPSPSQQISSTLVRMFVNDVTVLDYAYLDPIRGAMGGSLHVDAELTGHLDEESVIFDFSYAKKQIKLTIDECCDHRLVLPKDYVTDLGENRRRVDFPYGTRRRLVYECPEEALCQLDASAITIGSLQSYLEALVRPRMPENVVAIELSLRQEKLERHQAHYHYTHGLKQHYGNCQRLLHGHRNKLDIWLNEEKSCEMETWIAKEWADIHLALLDNVEEKDIRLGQRQNHLEKVTLEYQSSQGLFRMELPGSDVYVMKYETTVESIAVHMAEKVAAKLAERGESAKVRVRSYEGIRKGAEVTI